MTNPEDLAPFSSHQWGCAARRGSLCDCGLVLRIRTLAEVFDGLADWSRGLTYGDMVDRIHDHVGDADE